MTLNDGEKHADSQGPQDLSNDMVMGSLGFLGIFLTFIF